MARAIAIWVCGLLGSGILGSGVLGYLDQSYSDVSGLFGFSAGILLFTCARLWAKEPPKISN